MKKFNNKKSVIEKGGLMIEALAMLGLIAVVTPTMYKKSAERTMEVEDINTASAIRSYMNSWNDLVAAHYIDIMEVMEDGDIMTKDDISTKVSELDATLNISDEFERYLPYGYKPDKDLYNYGNPEFAVARQGNNLTAFMVFPSKSQDEDSIGQERTVRIASLIGSNGGYVRGGKARGVGGTWSLSEGDLGKVGGNAGEYSIVTSSVDAINSSTGGLGQDNEKYLQRTAENGELWRNMMHTDIYMGNYDQTSGDNPYGDDRIDPNTKGFFSIRNINQLIVGADGHAKAEDNEDGAMENAPDYDKLYVHNGDIEPYDHKTGDREAYDFKDYALYVSDDTENGKDHGINAYIAGSLEAAAKRFFVDENEIMYDGTRVQLGLYKEDSSTEGEGEDAVTTKTPHYLINARSGHVQSASDEKGSDADANVVKLLDDQIVVSDDVLGNGDGFEVSNDPENPENSISTNKYKTNILMASGKFKGADNQEGKSSLVSSDGQLQDIEVKYTQDQQFPVMVDSNMLVNGVLAAGQVDTQHIRSASLSTGSEKIDDKIKWMDVDNEGIHIRNRDDVAVDEDNPTKVKSAKSQVEINNEAIVMRFDKEKYDLPAGDEAKTSDMTDHGTQVIMDNQGVLLTVHNNDSNEKQDIIGEGGEKVGDASTARRIVLATDEMGMDLGLNEMTVGGGLGTSSDAAEGDEYQVKYQNGGHVDMVGTTLQVTDADNKPIFTIQGNDNKEENFGTNYNDQGIDFDNEGKRKDTSFRIAGHGNTVFTSDDTHEEGGAYMPKKFLAMGVDTVDDDGNMNNNQYNAAVNIVANTTNGGEDRGQRVVYIDLDNTHDRAYVESTEHGTELVNIVSNGEKPGKGTTYMPAGSIYIRKGLIELSPDANDVVKDESDPRNGPQIANAASGTIRASRFVANNYDKEGKRVKYNNPIRGADSGGSVYAQYNGSSKRPYDTYMVNPAYTSVMKDIKLTSRLGARLSDILPDFITKAIYISRNNKKENTINILADGMEKWDNKDWDSSKWPDAKRDEYVSPYLGRVVSPQCPPGYGRVITVVPKEFKMAQVGYLQAVPQTAGSGYYVNDEWGSDAGGTHENPYIGKSAITGASKDSGSQIDRQAMLNDVEPQFAKVTLAQRTGAGEDDDVSFEFKSKGGQITDKTSDSDVEKIMAQDGIIQVQGTTLQNENLNATIHTSTLNLSHGFVDVGNKKFKLNNINNLVIAKENDKEPETSVVNFLQTPKAATYVLQRNKEGMPPVTFQQSTWLKANTIQLEGKTSGYMAGWAVFMGFIYPEEVYGDIVKNVTGSEPSHLISNEIGSAENTSKFYWNVFPVKPGTIEGIVTTYCYFDNKKASKGMHLLRTAEGDDAYWWKDGTSSGSNHDSFDYQYDTPAESYYPSGNNAKYRKEQLNDPALKYDELW